MIDVKKYFEAALTRMGLVTNEMLTKFTAEQFLDIIDRNAEGFTVGLLGVLSPRFRVAFEVALAKYVKDELMGAKDANDQEIDQTLAELYTDRVTFFLKHVRPWEANHYMLRVVTSPNEEDRLDILFTMFMASSKEDDAERQTAMRDVLNRVVGDKPLLTLLGEYIAAEAPNAWDALTRRYPRGLAEFAERHWPELKDKTNELWHWFVHGNAPNQAGQPATGWQGALTESQKLLEWSERIATEAEDKANQGGFLAGGRKFQGLFRRRTP